MRAKNTFLTVGLPYGTYTNNNDIVKRSFELIKLGADAIYCPQGLNLIKAIIISRFLSILTIFFTIQYLTL